MLGKGSTFRVDRLVELASEAEEFLPMASDKVSAAGYKLISEVCTTEEFAVHRALSPDRGHVLLKVPACECLPAAAILQLEHEYETARELDPVFVVKPFCLEQRADSSVLVLEDFDCRALASDVAEPLGLERFFKIAVSATAALAALHRQGVVHKDIKPDHIFLADHTDGSVQVKLTGFGIASRLSREHQAPDAPEAIAGTLAYMAPEQTGRMNRSIDARSDLYSLGVTFYRMLAGRLPFSASDPMGWVHCHIAQQPPPPSQYIPDIPQQISDIVLKLMAKNAEDRYQTAVGLKADLERCEAEWRQDRRISPFPLGAHDIPDRLLIPEKLYGRKQEVETLLAAYHRVAASGKPEAVLVSGYSGAGKSALVNELQKALALQGSLFISGKFDQYKRGIPYSTLAQAFKKLVRFLLGKSEAELEGWRRALSEALEPNGQLIATLVPELKLIIGEPPPAPDLEPQQAKARFQLVFRRFIGLFARAGHPLVLFLDDLQWLDAATLDVVADLLTHEEIRHLLLIGAYRDNEVSPGHPLMRKVAAIRDAGAKVEQVTLAPLTLNDLTQLTADALYCDALRAEELAGLLAGKTAGNPFFAIQFLSALAQEGLLAFDHAGGRWSWDLSRIQAKGYTDNVADLMATKLTRLAAATQNALRGLACLGSNSESETLSCVLSIPEEELHAALSEAVDQELVQRLDGSYRFVHDRVQEAAYALIPEASRAEAHLRIGRLLLAHTPQENLDKAVFEIVSQLNRGAVLMTSQEEREELAKLNLMAGKRAKASTAYAAARAYLAAGVALLAEDCWERQHEIAFALELNRAECEFVTGELATAEQRLATLSEHATNAVEQSAVACLRVDVYTTLGQMARAITVGLDYLRLVGIEWVEHPTDEEARREYERIWSHPGSRTSEDLIRLPLMSDPTSRATIDLLSRLVPPTRFTDANLFCLSVCRAVNLSLQYGNCDASCYAYATLGLIAGPLFGDYMAGFRFGQGAYELVEQRGLKRFQQQVFMIFGNMVLPWVKHVRGGREMLRRAFEVANRLGDLTFAAYTCDNLSENFLVAGDPLADMQREAEHGLAYVQKTGFEFVADTIIGHLGLIRTLRGLAPEFGCFDDKEFSERQFEQHLSSNPDLAVPEGRYWIRKLQTRFIANDYAAALAASEQAERLLWATKSYIDVIDYDFYGALTQAACCDSCAASQRQHHLEALAGHRKQLEIWEKNCAENFENRTALVNAEIARLEGRPPDAMRLYDQAIRSAGANNFIHNEAVAYETAGRFFFGQGLEAFGIAHLREARACYSLWGADGKVKQLDRLYPQLTARQSQAAGTSPATRQLDVAAVANASQAVSGEIELPKLIETLMRIALENAGADRGLLILPRGTGFQVEVEAKASGKDATIKLTRSAIAATECPETIVNYVVRTQRNVIVDDTSRPREFFEDVYLRRGIAKSVLCVPLLRQGKLAGVLYLENRKAAGAFTPDRIAVLEVLAAQAAISLENSRLYGDLRESEAKYSRIVNAAAEGIWVLDPLGNTVFVNAKMAEMLGLTAEEMVGRPLTSFMFEEDASGYLLNMEKRRQGLSDHFERRIRHKDGHTVWTMVSGAPVFDDQGNFQGAFGMHTDITERKRAEQEMALLNFALNNVREAAYLIDENARLKFVNEGACRMLGYTRDELLGMGVADVDPDFPSVLWPEHWSDLKARRSLTFETRQKKKEGSSIPIEVNANYIEYNNSAYNLALVRDITERRQAEAELHRYQDNLEELVEQRTAELLLARNAAQAANKAKSVFLANMSHELRTPLNAILGFSSLMGREEVTASQRDKLGIINRSGEHLLTLINDVLEMAKIEAGRLQLEKAPFDLGALVRGVIDMMRLRAQEKGLTLLFEQSSSFPRFIRGDEARLRQILVNLLGNAVKFTETGGVTVRLGTRQNDRQHLIMEVEDTGVGIRAEDQDRLFQPFVQLAASTMQKGTGLGLAITHQFIELMGGSIRVTSAPGKGSIFRVELPVEIAVEAAGSAYADETAPEEVCGLVPGQPAFRILIAEDHRENQLLLEKLMSGIGLEVRVAANGEECVVLYSEWRPHLIWMDRRMPVMDGITATQRIRQLPGGGEVKIVAVTASAFQEQRQELLDAGMDEFVRKPYRIHEIYDCLAQQLDVKYIYRSSAPAAEPPAALTAVELATLPASLRADIKAALESLDDDLTAAAIDKVRDHDAQLASTLARLAENFEYPAILAALVAADRQCGA
jgi:PAS domain S-box-containing protein